MTGRVLSVRQAVWPIRGVFTISRGSRTEARTLIAEIVAGGAVGRGECTPYARYGESLESVTAQIESVVQAIADGADRPGLEALLPPGAARNAVDCALWDLESKLAGVPAWALAGILEPGPVTTVYTLSLDTVEKMGEAARQSAHRPLLKLKLTGDGDLERVQAVRANAPASRLVVDANEAWSISHLERFGPVFAALGVEVIEQPLKASEDDALLGFESPIPLCADESCHDTASLDHCAGKYAMVNIKLDKAGGLTEALRLRAAARERGFAVMVGCMVASSLAMAPATLVAQGAEVVDLDGPLLLAQDHDPALRYDGATVYPPEPALWG
ncbi:MAG: dipeptide epimerase [Inquilinus limosus]|uniref:Dipeptide epimerase n=1 Tax=Inquilinus limosus TaxID=171674 RepID=A0A952FRS9_9PROT|nr:dipeptide epimerase [Inquilinus limosus]